MKFQSFVAIVLVTLLLIGGVDYSGEVNRKDAFYAVRVQLVEQDEHQEACLLQEMAELRAAIRA